MTENKRYYAHKHLLHENEVHDKRCHNFMGLDETVEHLNNEYWKYKQLKNENEQLKQRNQRQYERLKELTDLMFKRDWKTLETMVDEWEKEEEQLQKYGG